MASTEGEAGSVTGAPVPPAVSPSVDTRVLLGAETTSIIGPSYIYVGGGEKPVNETGGKAEEPGKEIGTEAEPGKEPAVVAEAVDPGKGTVTTTATGTGEVAETETMKGKDAGTSTSAATDTSKGKGAGAEKGTGKPQESVPEKKKGRSGRRMQHPELSAEERRKLRVLKNRESAMRSLQKKAAYSKELEATQKSVQAKWDKAKGELRGEIEELNKLKSDAETVRKSTHLEELLQKADELLAKMQAAVESKGEPPPLAEDPVSANA